MKRRLRRRKVYPDISGGGLELTAVGDVRITGKLGEGVACIVYRGDWEGREVTLKLYKSSAVEWHARYHHQELAEFEYCRNLAFYEAPGLAPYVAEPLGYLATGGVSAMVQERLDGVLYDAYHRSRGGRIPDALLDHVRRVIELAHEAGLYDVDLHARNIMVVRDPDGRPFPKLFDFNFIPFYDRPPNPLVALMLKTGLIGHRSRDLRKLRHLHNFRGRRRKPPFEDR